MKSKSLDLPLIAVSLAIITCLILSFSVGCFPSCSTNQDSVDFVIDKKVCTPSCECDPCVCDPCVCSEQDSRQSEEKLIKDDKADNTSYSVVEYYGAEWCVPCKKWKQVELPKLAKIGWVIEQYKGASGELVPYFYIRVGAKKSKKIVGYMDMPRMKKELKKMGFDSQHDPSLQ